MEAVLIAFFGLCGVLARHYAGLFASRRLPANFPSGTLLVNLTGSFLIGVIATAAIPFRIPVMAGFLGGFTTFSSYCLDTVNLMESGQRLRALGYFALTPLLGLFSAGAGITLATHITSFIH